MNINRDVKLILRLSEMKAEQYLHIPELRQLHRIYITFVHAKRCFISFEEYLSI